MAFGAWEDGGRERKAYGVMGIELRAREPSVAEGVAPLRLAWSDGAGFRGVFWTSFRNWSLFIFVVFPRRMVWWLRRRKVDGRWKYFEVMDCFSLANAVAVRRHTFSRGGSKQYFAYPEPEIGYLILVALL